MGEYFQNRARCEKVLKDTKHNSLHLGPKCARTFVLGHYLFLVAQEQIMSADKYPSIFSRQMEAIVYITMKQYTKYLHKIFVGMIAKVRNTIMKNVRKVNVNSLSEWSRLSAKSRLYLLYGGECFTGN